MTTNERNYPDVDRTQAIQPLSALATEKAGTILVVEDAEPWREALTNLFETENYTVTSTDTAEEAMHLLENGVWNGVTVDGLGGKWREPYELAGAIGIRAAIVSDDVRIREIVGEKNFFNKSIFLRENKRLRGFFK